ncbi:MAG: glycosyltransferase family 2 protein [Burkholderiaceae bacterium]
MSNDLLLDYSPGDQGYRSPMISIVVPLYNEADNVESLLERIHGAMNKTGWPWHLILVDDGSGDRTAERLRDAVRRYPQHACAIILQRNFGQTAAMQAGIDAATGSVIVTMDGDLQNNPADIPRMVRRLLDEDLDLLVGWRHHRRDNLWLKTLPSWLANRLIAGVTGVELHDYGCSLKVFRASVIKHVRLYGEMHRFIPTWMATLTSPARIREEPVSHFPRIHGRSKYGLSPTLRVLLDLLSMYFFMRFRAKPGHFFGRIGMLFVLSGMAFVGYLAFMKFFHDEDIGNRPMLIAGISLMLAGVQFVCTGIVTELLTRTYYEATDTKTYLVREIIESSESAHRTAGQGAENET